MLVVVLLALGGARFADPGAQLEHLLKHRVVGAGPANRQLAGGFADVGAIEAGANALGHVHRLGRAGIGAAHAHARAIHQVVGGIAQGLVDVPSDLGVKRDHLANGHEGLLWGGRALVVDSSVVALEKPRPQG